METFQCLQFLGSGSVRRRRFSQSTQLSRKTNKQQQQQQRTTSQIHLSYRANRNQSIETIK